MYVQPQRARRGLGDFCAPGLVYDPSDGSCNPVPATAAQVFGCAPDICLDWRFPWLGRRTENPAGAPPCVCQPVFTVPAPFGAVISAALGLAIGFKLFRGVTG